MLGTKLSEKQIENDIIIWLGYKGIYSWKVKTVGTFDTKLGRFRKSSPLYKKGVSDILGILDDGTFLAIEVKSKRGRLSPEQKIFLDEIKSRGGLSILARCREDVETALDTHKRGKIDGLLASPNVEQTR